MTKNGNVLSLDLMTIRYLAESMNGSGRNEKDVKGMQRMKGRSVEFDEWQDETDIILRSDERARSRKIWRG